LNVDARSREEKENAVKRIAVGVGVFLVALLMLMVWTSAVMAQTGGPDFTTQSNKKSPLDSGKWKAPDVVGAQKKNPVKPAVNPYPPRPGSPQQSSPAKLPAFKPSTPQQTNKPNSTYVVKQNQDSPARSSCLAKCTEDMNRYRAKCNKGPDPVEASNCVKMGEGTYRSCAGKCPAK